VVQPSRQSAKPLSLNKRRNSKLEKFPTALEWPQHKALRRLLSTTACPSPADTSGSSKSSRTSLQRLVHFAVLWKPFMKPLFLRTEPHPMSGRCYGSEKDLVEQCSASSPEECLALSKRPAPSTRHWMDLDRCHLHRPRPHGREKLPSHGHECSLQYCRRSFGLAGHAYSPKPARNRLYCEQGHDRTDFETVHVSVKALSQTVLDENLDCSRDNACQKHHRILRI
jgi:hypothetical protein